MKTLLFRPKWQFVEKFKDLSKWNKLDDVTVNEINENLSGLPIEQKEKNQDDLGNKNCLTCFAITYKSQF